MKKLFTFLCLSCLLAANAAARETCRIQAQLPVKLLSAELKRGFKTLRKQDPPVYYLAYTYWEGAEQGCNVSDGIVSSRWNNHVGRLDAQVRAGSVLMDGTRKLKNGKDDYSSVNGSVPWPKENGKAFTSAVWRLTQQAAERAQKDFSRVQADVQGASQRFDDSPDFVFPPAETHCSQIMPETFDMERIEKMLVNASKTVMDNPLVLDASFSFSAEQGHRYFVDSVGSRQKTPFAWVRMNYFVAGKTADGLEISRSNSYDVLKESELPSEETLIADVKRSVEELELLSRAPEAEPVTVPAILKNRAMGVFVHEVLGHRMEGHRQKEDSFGRTFTSKVGQMVTAPFLSVVDDATLESFGGIPLRGFYEYDDEGVKARPVVMIENGVLRNFLMSSSPIKNFPASNGHGRREPGRRAVARMGVTRVTASETVPYEELEQMLRAEIKKQGAPYGLIIEDLSGGFTMTDTNMPQVFKLEPKLVYRVYADGRKEAVRGADLVGTPLVSFLQAVAASDDYAVFNGSCGAESGWVPVSAIAPSILFRTLEFEQTAKSAVKPPVLLPPAARKGGKK